MAPKRARDSRPEQDLLGCREAPADAGYGIQTLRCLENFHISGVPLSDDPKRIEALATIQMAAAPANREEFIDDRFMISFNWMFQGDAGTSTKAWTGFMIASSEIAVDCRVGGSAVCVAICRETVE